MVNKLSSHESIGKTGEFDTINTFFTPLSVRHGRALIGNDTASLEAVVTVAASDSLVEDIHYLKSDKPVDIARKLLRVNISDFAASGAEPLYYLLNLSGNWTRREQWLADFTVGLEIEQKNFGLRLAGGDMTTSSGPDVLSATMLGRPWGQCCLSRSGAHNDDLICVSGTLGNAALGLEIAQQKSMPKAKMPLVKAYRLPEPRLKLGFALAPTNHHRNAHAAIDISDGLLADLGHLLQASRVGAMINSDAIPLSLAAQTCPRDKALSAALTGGDDYEILFTWPPWRRHELADLAERTATKITIIGNCVADPEARLLYDNNQEIPWPKSTGFRHF